MNLIWPKQTGQNKIIIGSDKQFLEVATACNVVCYQFKQLTCSDRNLVWIVSSLPESCRPLKHQAV